MATLVSLPEHLRQTLLALLEVPPPPILTDDLATQLRPYVTPPGADPSLNLSPAPAPGAKPTIPNSLLSQVSKHVRSVRCRTALEANNLDPRDYEMIALLAGVRTISSATADPPETADTSRQNTAKQWAEDRRALTAVVNGLFSIGGVGFAVWYAAGSAGWGEEWRALLALFAGLVVAASEGILFVIWQDRIEKRRTQDKARREHKARLREKARDKYDQLYYNKVEEKRAPADGQHGTPIPGAEQGYVPSVSADEGEPLSTPPDQGASDNNPVLISSPGEDHPTLRRRAPPTEAAEKESDEA